LSYLAPFRRYGDLLVENRLFVPTPPSFNALARGDPLRILGWTWYSQKLEWLGYHMVKKPWSYVEPCGHSARVWQTDGWTDGRTELRSQRPCNAERRTVKSLQESCAIAKMTAQCALYMGALDIFGTPWLYAHSYVLFPTFFMNFCLDRSYECLYKISSPYSFTHSWDNRGYAKKLGSPWLRPRSLFSKILMGFYSHWSCKCTRQIWSPYSFTCSWDKRG